MAYDFVRALHIIAFIAWMAGMLMLPRLLVYRLEADDAAASAMDTAARRLTSIILTPSMLLVWISGLALIGQRFGASVADYPFWLWMKLILVLAMTALHGVFSGWRRKVANGERPVSARRMRIINEAPFVLAVIIVVMAVVEP